MTRNCDSQTPNLHEGEGIYCKLPPGFVFVPTDQEIISDFLSKKVIGEDLPSLKLVDEVDLYTYHPKELVEKYKSSEKEGRWYFFTWPRRKYENGQRSARSAANGFWKATLQNRGIMNGDGTEIGCKKTLTFVEGKQTDKANQKTTGWLMQEYRLPAQKPERTQKSDELVLCKIYCSERWKEKENDATNAPNVDCTKDETNTMVGSRPICTKDATNTTVGNHPNCTKDATNATIGNSPRNKRQKKSSNPTPAPSHLTQQQPQPYAPQIPSQNPVQLLPAQTRAPNLQQNVSGQHPVQAVSLQTRKPQEHLSTSLIENLWLPDLPPPPPVIDFTGVHHGCYYYGHPVPLRDLWMPCQNFHLQQQHYLSTFSRYRPAVSQQASTHENMRQSGASPSGRTPIQQAPTSKNIGQGQFPPQHGAQPFN